MKSGWSASKENIPGETASKSGNVIRTNWLNPHRKRFWVIVVVLFYTATGFFLVPVVIKNALVSLIQEDLGRSAEVEKVAFNPYVLSLRVGGFEMLDTDGQSLAAFDELRVNFQLSSLFRRAWTFREIRLDGLSVFLERFDARDSRLGRLLNDLAALKTPETPGNGQSAREKSGLPRLLIHDLTITDGRVDARDNLPSTPVETYMAQINISIQELNTLPDRHGRQFVTIELPNGASLHWEGSLTLSPLDSEGELVLENSDLAQTISYIEALLPLNSINVRMSSRFHYRIHMEDDGKLNVEIDDIELELNELAVSGLSPATDFLETQKITLLGGKLRYPARSLQFASIQIDQPRLTAWRSSDGILSLQQLRLADRGAQAPSEKAMETVPWHVGTDKLVLQGGRVDLSDQSVSPAATVALRDLELRLSQISNAENKRFPLRFSGNLSAGGSFSLDGELGLLPKFSLEVNSHTEGIPLAIGQPYVQKFLQIHIEGGSLDSDVELSVQSGQPINVNGSIRIPGLEISDTIKNERLLEWIDLNIDQFDLNLDQRRIHISSIILEQPYGRIAIFDDQSTNLSELLLEKAADSSESAPPGSTASDKEPFGVVVGGIRISDGAMDFSDFSLPLPFATHIAELDGTISTIANNSSEPANIKLEGQVNEYGLARIDGTMNILDPIQHTGVTLEFRNLLMSDLSPYSIQFAGQEIDQGKLDLDLNYAIDNGQLHGQNNVVLRDLVLGDKVDHPDAASLPLSLAVALLKDGNGVIDIDLTVEGDINDPEFGIGSVVWQAFSGLITKIISAPFRLLGKLIGIDSEDLGQFEFLAGRSDLTPPELEKIAQLEEALRQRPELKLEISGVTDPSIDVPTLKYKKLRDLAVAQIGEEYSAEDDEAMMLDTEIRQFLESLFIERFPNVDLTTLKAEHMAPAMDDPEGTAVLDKLAYSADLRDRLLESEPVSDEDLENLAQERAQAIKTAFLSSGQFDPDRVQIGESKKVSSENREWVVLELTVASD